MLSLDKPFDIDGITVFRDHADPNQFWYLPGPVRLARRQDNSKKAAFSFIKYKPAVAGAGIKGGGFTMFETTLALDPNKEEAIKSRAMTEPGATAPRLSPVMFESGTVQCIALNLKGTGSTTAAKPPPGAFNAVEEILGATTPSMDASNRAAFSLTLSQEGAIILENAFKDGLAPIGVLYSFTYSGMRPALEVEITADLQMIYDHFSASLEAQYQFVRAGIDAAFESLKQIGAIKIKVLSFSSSAEAKEREDWAMAFLKDDLLTKWFTPTSTPGKLATEQAKADPLDAVAKFNNEVLHGIKPDDDPKKVLQPATLAPAGKNVSHTPSATGTQETVTVTGAGATVKVDGKTMALDQKGQFTVDVQPEKRVPIEITWPAPVRQETFHLYFDYDKPSADKWSVSPPSDSYKAYVTNNVADQRFLTASGIADGDSAAWTTSERGADRLKTWLKDLASPKQVEIDAYAGFEQSSQTGQSKADYNKQLSSRRSDVAEGIISSAGVALSRASAVHGDTEARSDPNNSSAGNPNDRVVKIKGKKPAGEQLVYQGTLSRPKSKEPQGDTESDPNKEKAKDTMPGVISLKLKYVRQEELKKMTFSLNRAEATTRTYAPQGFFGLLLADLADPSGYFTEVDLDDPFFRELNIQAESPVDFTRIGLSSAQVALDYGDPKNPKNHKHCDFVFREGDKGPKNFTVFLNSTHDVDYLQQQQFHFNPDSGWSSNKHSVELPAVRTADRTLFINPYDVLDFLEITVIPGDIDAGIVASTEATLRAVGPAGFDMKKTFIVLADSPPQVWKLRALKPAESDTRTVTCVLKHRLKGGAVREQPPIELTSSTLFVHDPFVQPLNIEFIPMFDAAKVKQVYIDVEYDDPENSYSRSERLNIMGDQTDIVKLRIALLDPKHREFRYRFTVVGTDGVFQRLAYQTSGEEVIPIQV